MSTGRQVGSDRDRDFSEFVDARYHRLVQSAVLMGCAPHEAEDLVQSALVKCYASWSRVDQAENRDAYVYRILLNTRTQTLRRKWRNEIPTDNFAHAQRPDPSASLAIADAVQRALSCLTEDQRRIVILRYFADLSEEQAAKALGVPLGTVKSRLSRALRVLSQNPHLADDAPRRP